MELERLASSDDLKDYFWLITEYKAEKQYQQLEQKFAELSMFFFFNFFFFTNKIIGEGMSICLSELKLAQQKFESNQTQQNCISELFDTEYVLMFIVNNFLNTLDGKMRKP